MKILLVEDEAPKLEELKNVFKTMIEVSLDCARSVRSAIDYIRGGNSVDVIVADMSLPTFDIVPGETGGDPQAFGGIEIMRYLLRAEIECPVIVVTGYPSFEADGAIVTLAQLEESMRREFGEILVAVIQYSVTSDEWIEKLRSQVINSRMQ